MRNRILSSANVVLMLVIMVLTSCASHKNSQDVLSQEGIVASGSVTIKTGDNDMSAPAQIHILKNKVARVQVMMPILGSEIARAEFTPDNVLVVDRMNKQYLKETYDALNKAAGVKLSFSEVQKKLLDYLGAQKEITLSLPSTGATQSITLSGEFNNIKASTDWDTVTEVSQKYKKMQISDLKKLIPGKK